MKLDIHSAVVAAVIITILGALLSVWNGIRGILNGRRVTYYHLRRRQVALGWRAIFFAMVLLGFAFLVRGFGESVTFRYFPPSPSPSPTPTISMTPTISFTSTISLTPTITTSPEISFTPTSTGTPFLPMVIEMQLKSNVTPNPGAIFSPLVFSLKVKNFIAINPQTIFQNPLSQIYVTYTYDGMTNGTQWTAVWYLNGQLLMYKTISWDSGTGGFGQEELNLPTEKWLPGIYKLVFFVGTKWKVLGDFRVMGNPPTSTVSPTSSVTPTPSLTPSVSSTLYPTRTPRPTDTRWPTPTIMK